MSNTYKNLIEQSYQFPQEGFNLKKGYLNFNDISLKYLIEKYGTPFKLLYLPKIAEQINKARKLFNAAIDKHEYRGRYHYSYCTKCCHFSHVVKAAIKENVHIETSSSFDIDLIFRLFKEGVLEKETIIIHNGYKTEDYLKKILKLKEYGFQNSIIVLDSTKEINRIKTQFKDFAGSIKIGIRMAIDQDPKSPYYTSRLGIRHSEIINFFEDKIKHDDQLELQMVHFFIDSGIQDNIYYWGEFQKAMDLYIDLKKSCPSLNALNLGGGFPIRNKLGFEYDYQHIINEIVSKIKSSCIAGQIDDPDIFTEFGKYTVGESGAIIFSILEQKQQNESETWYMINNSLMNTIPDAWSILEKFILLPINKWENGYTRVSIGGISCDRSDYYNSEDLNQQLFLPAYNDEKDKEPLYIGFFHTGAYQDAISGYGGIKHCLIPAPKMIMIDKDENGDFIDHVYRNEQTVDEMLEILGYNKEE